MLVKALTTAAPASVPATVVDGSTCLSTTREKSATVSPDPGLSILCGLGFNGLRIAALLKRPRRTAKRPWRVSWSLFANGHTHCTVVNGTCSIFELSGSNRLQIGKKKRTSRSWPRRHSSRPVISSRRYCYKTVIWSRRHCNRAVIFNGIWLTLRGGSKSGPINLKEWRGSFEILKVTGEGNFFGSAVSESDSSKSCCRPLKRSLAKGDKGSSCSNRFSEDGDSTCANEGVKGFSSNATTSSSDRSMTGRLTTCFQYQLFSLFVQGESAACEGEGGPFSWMWSI